MANDFVKLSVGGILYKTSKATLTRYPDSMLGALFTGSVPSSKDDDGCLLIDRDGQIFRHILNFLRCGKLLLPNSFDEHDLLLSEAEFYKITPLVNAIQGESKKGAFPFYIVEFWTHRSTGSLRAVGTIYSLLQLPLLDGATQESLSLQVPSSTISAVDLGRRKLDQKVLGSAGWKADDKASSYIISTCNYEVDPSQYDFSKRYLKPCL